MPIFNSSSPNFVNLYYCYFLLPIYLDIYFYSLSPIHLSIKNIITAGCHCTFKHLLYFKSFYKSSVQCFGTNAWGHNLAKEADMFSVWITVAVILYMYLSTKNRNTACANFSFPSHSMLGGHKYTIWYKSQSSILQVVLREKNFLPVQMIGIFKKVLHPVFWVLGCRLNK